MEKRLNELLSKLSDSIFTNDFTDVAYDVIEEIEERADAFEALESILTLMESNPVVDFGNPGPLVHFVEKFYKKGYEEKLVESLERRPTKHTIWMLNRIINGSEGERKKYFIDIMDKVLTFNNLDSDAMSYAQGFRDLHL